SDDDLYLLSHSRVWVPSLNRYRSSSESSETAPPPDSVAACWRCPLIRGFFPFGGCRCHQGYRPPGARRECAPVDGERPAASSGTPRRFRGRSAAWSPATDPPG